MRHLKTYENNEVLKKYIISEYSDNYFFDEVEKIYVNQIDLKTLGHYSFLDDTICEDTYFVDVPLNQLSNILYNTDNYEDAKTEFYDLINLHRNSKKFGL